MENFIILAGLLAVLRAFWAYNLLREENGLSKGNFASYLKDRNRHNLYIIIRPFLSKMKNEKLRKKVNVISCIIYIFLIIGIVSIIMKNEFNYLP
jgi:hypothetical protein